MNKPKNILYYHPLLQNKSGPVFLIIVAIQLPCIPTHSKQCKHFFRKPRVHM